MIKKDIETVDDIATMVHTFYSKVDEDELLSKIFNDHVGVNWKDHLPKMVNFWNTVLFSKGTYKGSPFHKHKELPINKNHFSHWLSLFNKNLDEHFEGKNTEEAKKIAQNIGWTFQAKMKLL